MNQWTFGGLSGTMEEPQLATHRIKKNTAADVAMCVGKILWLIFGAL